MTTSGLCDWFCIVGGNQNSALSPNALGYLLVFHYLDPTTLRNFVSAEKVD